MKAAKRWPFVAVIVIGLGLALAPVAFKMFTRAPKGGHMITQFRPYMTTAKIDQFRGYLDEIDAADAESRSSVPAGGRYAAVDQLHQQWPGINGDMGDMLRTMRADIGRFRGVSALPPFPLFPFFFVIPGLMAVGFALAGWRRALIVLGIGVLAAPAIFQMFSRAPGGKAMIDDFRPLMTDAKVTKVQGYFLTIGAGEGQLRTEVVPAQPAGSLPAVERFSHDWPTISKEMAPMIGTMADNVGNFKAVDALPPFSLFPWFFVLPGVLIAGLALLGGPSGSRQRAVAAVPVEVTA